MVQSRLYDDAIHDAGPAHHARLDRDMILEASRDLCDREGLGALTLRRLGKELGVDSTAMYRHFKNKMDLLSALIDLLFADVPEPDPGRPWRENLTTLMRAWFDIYRRHVGLAEAMAGQADDQPRLFALTEWTVHELRRAGVPSADIGLFHQAIYNHTVGYGLVAALSPWMTTPSLRDEQRRIYSALDPALFPASSAASGSLYPDTDKLFDFGMGLLLDAIDERVREEKTGNRQ
jgi:AcrR family transcriptional regulator